MTERGVVLCLAESSQGGVSVDGAEFGSVLLCTVSDVGGVCSVGVARLVWVSVAAVGCSVCGEGVGVRRGGAASSSAGAPELPRIAGR